MIPRAPPRGKFPGKDNAPIQELGRLRTALKKLAKAKALTDADRQGAGHLPDRVGLLRHRQAQAVGEEAREVPARAVRGRRARTPRRALDAPVQRLLSRADAARSRPGCSTPTGPLLPEYRTLAWSGNARRPARSSANEGPIALPAGPAAFRPGLRRRPRPQPHRRCAARAAAAARTHGFHRRPRQPRRCLLEIAGLCVVAAAPAPVRRGSGSTPPPSGGGGGGGGAVAAHPRLASCPRHSICP